MHNITPSKTHSGSFKAKEKEICQLIAISFLSSSSPSSS